MKSGYFCMIGSALTGGHIYPLVSRKRLVLDKNFSAFVITQLWSNIDALDKLF